MESQTYDLLFWIFFHAMLWQFYLLCADYKERGRIFVSTKKRFYVPFSLNIIIWALVFLLQSFALKIIWSRGGWDNSAADIFLYMCSCALLAAHWNMFWVWGKTQHATVTLLFSVIILLFTIFLFWAKSSFAGTTTLIMLTWCIISLSDYVYFVKEINFTELSPRAQSRFADLPIIDDDDITSLIVPPNFVSIRNNIEKERPNLIRK